MRVSPCAAYDGAVSILSMLRTKSRLRVTAVLLCLLACTVQSFVAQTHVHSGKAALAGTPHAVLQSDNLPSDNDDWGKHAPGRGADTSCPLCQIVLHGGVAPALVVFVFGLAQQASASVPPADQVPSGTTVAISFNWQGRAPPLC